MAEFLLRIVDKSMTGNSAIDRHRLKAGSVIVIVDDGHVWSETEETNPDWKIIKIPGIKPIDLEQLTASDVGYLDKDSEKINPNLRRRSKVINVNALNSLLNNKIIKNLMNSNSVIAYNYIMSVVDNASIFDNLGNTNLRIIG